MHELLKKLKDAEAVTEFIDALWDADPDNEELEKVYDRARQQERKAILEIAETISSVTGMKVSQALTLIRLRRDRIEEILRKL